MTEDSLAQTPVGDAQPLGGEMVPDRLQDGAASEHKIGAFVADAGVGGALGIAHGAQSRDRRVDLRPPAPQSAARAPVIARQIEMHARNGRERAGGAKKMEAVATRLVRPPGDERSKRI